MTTARWQHRNALLLTGKVLVTGGRNASSKLNSAELFDPVSGTFSATGNMQRFRSLHRATALANGKVLVTGGLGGPTDTDNNTLGSAELYDPATGTFAFTASTPAMVNRRRSHMQILLPDGRVLIVGGIGGPTSTNTILNTAELYDPNTNTFTATGNMLVARIGPFIAGLPNGKVLVLGGHDEADNPIASAEIYDPATGTFSATGSPLTGRIGARVVALDNGQVLSAGGQTSSSSMDVTNTAELFDYLTGTFSATGSLITGRRDGYATHLPNGQVLFAGGINAGGTTLASAELYTPLFEVPVDFDGDGTSDVVVFRDGAWLFHDFTTGAQDGGVWTGSAAGCVPVAMDYGDGKTDFSQLCNGAWHFYNSDGSYLKGIWTGGVAGDLPVPADYDGDGTDDVVVYRGGAWLFYNFTTGAFDAAKSTWTGGGGSCIPAPMDYDGDGTADFTQLCNGAWHFYNDDGSYNKGIWTGGVAGDLPVPADYDGNGMDDVVVFRGGAWLFYDFATGNYLPGSSIWTGAPPHWTGGTSVPAPLDYDGDGKADFTVYSGGPWHFYNSNGTYNKGIWTGGVAGDKALSRRLLP
jgi:hypothetical protein